jgi:CRISPR-associated endonuclease Csy4
MKYYQDITLLPDAEANLGFLWQKVYQQLHLALVENKVTDEESAIGLSIPEYEKKKSKGDFPLGQKIRLFAQEQSELERLDLNHWLKRFMDYAHMTSIKAVPEGVTEFACFERQRVKGSSRVERDIMRSAQHQAMKFSLPLEERLKEVKERVMASYQESNLPFIRVNSLSSSNEKTKHSFPLFITMRRIKEEIPGKFSCYGLSRKSQKGSSTVPWF